MMIRFAFVAAVAGMAVIPTAAAAHGRTVHTIVVNVDGFDLSTKWGMDRTIRRVRGAVDTMCGDDETCRDEAWLSADWQVARIADRDQWRRRLAAERAWDRRNHRSRRELAWERPEIASPPPPPPLPLHPAPPPSRPPRLESVTVATTTTTTVTKTTRIILTYRVPPPDYDWHPR